MLEDAFEEHSYNYKNRLNLLILWMKEYVLSFRARVNKNKKDICIISIQGCFAQQNVNSDFEG